MSNGAPTPQQLPLWSIKGVRLGMTRLQVQAQFQGPPDPRSHGYFQHFKLGCRDYTAVHFNDQGVVSSVWGLNLACFSEDVCTEACCETASDPRRERVLAALGKPESISKVGEGEKWLYHEPKLEIQTHPRYPWTFLLGESDPTP